MSSLSNVFAGVAADLTELFGQSVTFTRAAEGAYDPTTGLTASATITNYTANVVPEEYSTFERTLEHIQQGDVKLTLPNPGTLPLEGDTAVVNGVTYRVMGIKRTTVNAVDVLYELQARV